MINITFVQLIDTHEEILHLNNVAFLLNFIFWANAFRISQDTGTDLKKSGF